MCVHCGVKLLIYHFVFVPNFFLLLLSTESNSIFIFTAVKHSSQVYLCTGQRLIFHFEKESVYGILHVRLEHWDKFYKIAFELLQKFFSRFSVVNGVRKVLSIKSQVQQILVLADKSLFPFLLQLIIQTSDHCVALVQYFKYNKYCCTTMNYAVNLFS